MHRSTHLAAVVVVGIALVGCDAFGSGSAREDPLVASLRGPYSARSVDAVVQALARVGVGVYASTDATSPMRAVTAPAIPLKFLAWQARNLALDVTNPGAGLTGADLDDLAPVADGNVPTSYLLAAYVKSGSTAGARLARALMGKLDWAHPAAISFPTLVLVFLIADVARAEQQGLPTPSSSVVTTSLRTAGTFTVSTLCTFLANWEDEVFATLFNLLMVPPSSNAILNFLGGLWNLGIGLVEEALKAVIKAFTAPVANLVRSIIAVIAVASEAVTLLVPEQVSLTANPPFNRYSNNPGTVTASLVDKDGAKWPQALQDCLSAFGVPVPPLDGPNHDPVMWTLIPPSGVFVNVIDMPSQLDSRNVAQLSYVTTQDQPSCNPPPDDVLVVRVRLHKAAADQLKAFLVNFFNGAIGQIPAIIRDIIQAKLDELLGGVLDKLINVTDVRDQHFIQIEHSRLPSSSCVTPSPTESPSPSASPQRFGIGYCDQLIYPGDTIAPVVNPSARVAGDVFDLNCPIGDPSDETLAKGFVVYYRYPNALGAQQLMGELLANGADSVTGVGDQAVVIPNCQRMIGATPYPASCAVARLCNQIVEARIQGQDALALVSLILHRLPTNCPTNQPPSASPTPSPPTLIPSPTPTPSP